MPRVLASQTRENTYPPCIRMKGPGPLHVCLCFLSQLNVIAKLFQATTKHGRAPLTQSDIGWQTSHFGCQFSNANLPSLQNHQRASRVVWEQGWLLLRPRHMTPVRIGQQIHVLSRTRHIMTNHDQTYLEVQESLIL